MSRVILASAASFETDSAVKKLTDKNINLTRIVTGVGLIQSALICARLSSIVRDRDVIFCCTGGVIADKFDGINLYSAATVRLAPIDVRQGQTALLSEFDPEIKLHPLEFGLESCSVCCSLGVTIGDEDFKDVFEGGSASTNVRIESMELYAVARAWLPVVRSLTAIVAATNATGPTARREWRENFSGAANETANFLAGALPNIMR